MHFMYPVPLMPLVEIIRGISTTDAVSSLSAFPDACQKQGSCLSVTSSEGLS